jgi:DNA-binding NtrC family response regulator
LRSHLDVEAEIPGFAMDEYRVLIIDDEPSLLKSLVAFFEDEGFYVQGAASGEEGLDLLRTDRMDAVIIDLRLPGIDGNETVLRAHELQPALRFLIHTGSTDYQIPPPLRHIGIEEKAVFLKPLPDLSVLTEAVRGLFR